MGLVVAIMSSVAEVHCFRRCCQKLERNLITERVRAGLRNACAKGKAPRTPTKEPRRWTDCRASCSGSGLERKCQRAERWTRNPLSFRITVFQYSGKGFRNAIGAPVGESAHLRLIKCKQTGESGGETPASTTQNRSPLLQGGCYAVLENACPSGIAQLNASARSLNTRIPYSPCASRIILNMLAKPNCSSVATTTARRE